MFMCMLHGQKSCWPLAKAAGWAAMKAYLYAGEPIPDAADAAAQGNGPPAEPAAEEEEGSAAWQVAMDDIRASLPENVWESISPEFYQAFWSLRYDDIVVPIDRCSMQASLRSPSHLCTL